MDIGNLPVLTEGYCQRLCNLSANPTVCSESPLLQILNIAVVPEVHGRCWHRLVLSDGSYYFQAMLAYGLRHLLEDNLTAFDCIQPDFYPIDK
jgi:hypothetical protein